MAKRRRGYFKHYNDAYSGESISQAMAEKQYFKVHLFWAILGRADQLGRAEFKEKLAYFARLLSVNLPKLCRELTGFHRFFDQVSVEIQSESVQICIANLSEYQENRGQKKGQKNDKKLSKKVPTKTRDLRLKTKDKENSSNKFSEFSPPNSNELQRSNGDQLRLDSGQEALAETGQLERSKRSAPRGDLSSYAEVWQSIPDSTKARWQALYPDEEWLKRTILKAVGYYLDNPRKKPKSPRGWAKALSSWLDRDWERSARYTRGNQRPWEVEAEEKRKRESEELKQELIDQGLLDPETGTSTEHFNSSPYKTGGQS